MCLKSVDSVTVPCFKSIENLVNDNKLKLVIPEIVKYEFINGITKRFQRSEIILFDIIKTLETIYFPFDIIEGEYSWTRIDTIRKEIKTDLEHIKLKYHEIDVDRQIGPIIRLMENNDVIRIPMDPYIMGEARKRTLIQRAPSHKKDSEKDCVIIESLLDRLPELIDDVSDKVYFVSNNTVDFSDPDDKKKLHPDIIADFKNRGINIVYSPYLAGLLKIHFGQQIDDAAVNHEMGLSIIDSLVNAAYSGQVSTLAVSDSILKVSSE